MSGANNDTACIFYKASTMGVGVSGGWTTSGNHGIPSKW